MKRILSSILALAVVAMVASTALAAPLTANSQAVITNNWVFDQAPTFAGGLTSTGSATFSGTTTVSGAATFTGATTFTTSPTDTTGGVTASEIADVIRYVQLPLASFVTNGVPVTNATAPGVEIDDLVPGIVWADGETTPAQISFRVPADYASGGAFKVFATESNSTTPNQVDFSVYINSDQAAADSAATNQTPVAISGTTPDEITLTVATDFASLAAGDWVTLNLWRDNVATGTGDLEVKGVAFYYTATQ